MARSGRPLTVTLIVLGQSTQSLAFGGISLFLPLIRSDLGLSFAQSGTLAAASTLVYALMQVPSGYLADRFDPKRLFAIGLVGTNLMSILLAVVGSYSWLLVVQATSGLFRSMVFAPGMVLIREQFSPARRATAMGLYVAGGFSSSVLLNALGPLLVGPLGWQGVFVLFGIVGLGCAALFARVGQSPHREPGAHARWAEIRRVLAHPALWLTGVIQFVRLAVVLGFNFWLPTYVVVEKGFSLQVAGLVAAMGALLTAPSNVVGGWLSDRLQRPLLVIGISMVVLAATLATMPLVDGLVPLLILVGLNAMFVQLYFGPLFAVSMTYLGSRTAGLSAGFGNFCANVGGFVATYGLGALRDATGSFSTGFRILAGLCLVSLLATVAVARTRPLPDAAPTSPTPQQNRAAGRA